MNEKFWASLVMVVVGVAGYVPFPPLGSFAASFFYVNDVGNTGIGKRRWVAGGITRRPTVEQRVSSLNAFIPTRFPI